MSLPVDSYCLQCYLRRYIELVRPMGTEAQATAFAKDLMQVMLTAPDWAAAPWFSPMVADLLHSHYGLPIDRFHNEKLESNRFVLEHIAAIRARAEAAADPVYAGLQFAILGNYLDFAALQNQVSFEKLEEMLEQAQNITLDSQCYAQLCRDLAQGKKLLYLTDNAGEIGFDRVFAEQIAKKYPHLEITFCVRGDIAANDATREDAAAVGIPFPVIDSGSRVAGTILELVGDEAKQAIQSADVIIAKGMANTETMFGCGYNVYYAFLVKCPRFVRIFDKPMLTPMLIHDSQKK